MSGDRATTASSRPAAPELESILGQPLPVLDDGYVRVVDYMGSDAAIVQAARVSYGVGTKRVSEDRTLIRYLLRHRHTTPFEMCELKLHVRVPMDCWRQWIRHRTANVNEYSTRYSVAIDAASRTAADQWRLQTAANRQGSEGYVDPAVGANLTAAETDLQERARAVYQERLDAGVAREQARKDLPLSTYTEAYWKIDLHNLLHFLGLRADSHAQAEIRAYATLIAEQVVSRWVPLTWEAYLDYRAGGLLLTRAEREIAACLNTGRPREALRIAEQAGWLRRRADPAPGATGSALLRRNRERAEAEQKLAALGLTAPWLTTLP
jgi:thymidylate synthase (FAD)